MESGMLAMAALSQGLAEVRMAMAGRPQAIPAVCAEPGCSTLVLWAAQSGRQEGSTPVRGSLQFVFTDGYRPRTGRTR